MESGGNSPLAPASGSARQLVRDAHVHCYPPEVIADPRGWARRHREAHWERLVTSGPQGWADPEALLRAMDADGVECALLQAWYWENPDTARRQNDWHAAWVARYPGRLLACAAIHPGLPDPVAELEAARQWGALAIGECLPQVQSSQAWAHPAWATVLEWTSAAGWPCCLHLTEPAGHAYPGRVETPLREVLDIMERHPRQKWLLAHWGGGLPFYTLNRRVRAALGNAWFDTAASPLLYDSRVWRIVVDLVGAERVVFGSDFPLLLYPRRDASPGWRRIIDEFHASGLGAIELNAVARENFRLLFG
jgi:uncharacterized protein